MICALPIEPTETKVDSATSQSKSGTSVNLSNSGERLQPVLWLLPARRGQNLGLSVLYLPYSLDCGSSVFPFCKWKCCSQRSARSRANMQHISLSKPDSGCDFHLKMLRSSEVAPTWLACRGAASEHQRLRCFSTVHQFDLG